MALVGTALLLVVVEARTARLQSLQTEHQFCQTQTVDFSACTQVDGLDLALLTPLPVLSPPARLTSVVENARPDHPSRIEKFPSHVRPPPAA